MTAKPRVALVVIGCILVLLGISLAKHRRPPESPVHFALPTLEAIANPHALREYGLRLCGRSFTHVRGGPPYFLALTNSQLLLFAYEASDHQRTLVACDTNRCLFREVPLGDCVFGDQIGYWEATHGKMGDLAWTISPTEIRFVSRGFRYTERGLIDLAGATVKITSTEGELHQLNTDGWAERFFRGTNATAPPND